MNPDGIYLELSKVAYNRKPKEFFTYKIDENVQSWNLVDHEEYTLTDSETGFDAMIVKKDDQIIVAFRGTEPDQGIERAYKDLMTDAKHIFFEDSVEIKRPIPKPKGPLGKIPIKENVSVETNQFVQAEQLIQDIKRDYPKAQITVTGHSLGGALAQFVAVLYDLGAVTYSAPSIVNILPKKFRKNVFAGEYDSTIVNFVHPKDSIGAGPFGPYERHAGSTYYIGTKYEYENWEKQNQPISRLIDSIKDFHSMDHYRFDSRGYLNNPIIYNVLTGREEYISPRYVSAVAGQIKVHPEDLKEASQQIKITSQEVEESSRRAKAIFQKLLFDDAKCSQTIDVGYTLVSCLQKVINFSEVALPEFAHKLEIAAEEYERADKLA